MTSFALPLAACSLALLVALCPSSAAGCDSVKYVQLDRCPKRADTNATCGRTSSQPCHSIASALSSVQQGRSTCVRLLVPVTVHAACGAPTEDLSGVENVTIEPWPKNRQTSSPGAGCTTRTECNITLAFNGVWISLVNSSSVTLRNLHVTVVGQLTAVRVSRSVGVTVSNCQFDQVGINAHAVWFQNSWPVTISQTEFTGKTTSRARTADRIRLQHVRTVHWADMPG